jgi:hypothetical protein
MQRVPFFLVWAEDGGEPRRQHPDLPSAQREADRLARLHPGDRFFVLAPLCASRRSDIEREAFDVASELGAADLDDGIPF